LIQVEPQFNSIKKKIKENQRRSRSISPISPIPPFDIQTTPPTTNNQDKEKPKRIKSNRINQGKNE
jgi:hypothetical protein